ncbi:MAG: ribose-5-phosphate isomerase RpiA [Candidatus Methanofastidiosia archaeon]
MNVTYLKQKAAQYATDITKDEQIIGMGTGSTIALYAELLGKRVRGGEKFYAVPTSFQSFYLCIKNGINITTLDENIPEVAFDGADEVNPNKCLIKGRGGALALEKIVDYAASKFYVVIDETKIVKKLGTNFPLPIEIIPQSFTPVMNTLSALGKPALRMSQAKDGPVISDNGNFIIDLKTEIENPKKMEKYINNIAGVVENGIFTKKCKVILAHNDIIDVK